MVARTTCLPPNHCELVVPLGRLAGYQHALGISVAPGGWGALYGALRLTALAGEGLKMGVPMKVRGRGQGEFGTFDRDPTRGSVLHRQATWNSGDLIGTPGKHAIVGEETLSTAPVPSAKQTPHALTTGLLPFRRPMAKRAARAHARLRLTANAASETSSPTRPRRSVGRRPMRSDWAPQKEELRSWPRYRTLMRAPLHEVGTEWGDERATNAYQRRGRGRKGHTGATQLLTNGAGGKGGKWPLFGPIHRRTQKIFHPGKAEI